MRAMILALLALLTITVNAQTPDPQKQLMEAMARGCKALADEVAAGRLLIKAQAEEIKAGQQALTDERAAGAEKSRQIEKQDQLLGQKDITIKETSAALDAQKKATDTAVGALNVERAKNSLLKKVVFGGAVVLILGVVALAH